MTRDHLLSIACLALAAAVPVGAQPFPTRDLPPELRPWVPWVLDEVETLGCPRVQKEAVCLWPGRLQLRLAATGGTFSIDLQADRAAVLPLPGSSEVWPQEVRLDGAVVPVYEGNGSPRLRVSAGRHRATGRFSWSRMPESLSIPPAIGLVDLNLDGRPVARPRREPAGSLWLRARAVASREGDSLRLQVFRRIGDGIPVFVETRIQLEVAGRAREVELPGVLLPGSVPTAVTGGLPARVEDGTLRVQVRGGRHTVVIVARLDGVPATIERASQRPSSDWPKREVWVFAANEKLRQVEVSGPPPIDPSRTELPQEWRSLPSFLVEPGARLDLKEVRRGQPSPPPDAITLHRVLWLDPDGGAASVRDTFTGKLYGTRLDLAAEGTLGRVAVDNEDQLVTANPENRASGVELRRESLRLEADSRLALLGGWKAVGWTTGVEQLSATLNLPPGWTLLGASGVDSLGDTWTARWTLLGFFFVLVVTLAIHRLFGRWPALLALATLVFLHGEPGAPFLVWLSLAASIALRRVTPTGRPALFARLWFLVSAGILIVVTVPFARDQVTTALYPQVHVDSAGGGRPGLGAVQAPVARQAVAPSEVPADEEGAPPPPPPPAAGFHGAAGRTEKAKMDAVSREQVRLAFNQALEQDPKAVLQTGPGVPNWRWSSYALGWSGPVGRDHTVRLVLASPGWNRVLTLVRLLLLTTFGFLLVAGRWPRLPRRAPGLPSRSAGLSVLALLLLAPTAQAAQGNAPSSELLEQLKQRLTRPAACEPRCVSTPNLVLRLGANRLELRAEVHAAADGAWALPGPLASWTASELRVDGRPAVAAAHLSDGFLRVRLTRGVHRIEASGPLPPGDSFTLQLADLPHRARAEAPGWEVSGLRSDAPPEPSILLTRRLTTRAGVVAEGRYAPWLQVTRTLGFGVAWKVETRVRRLTPPGTPIVVRVPLLDGESPTRPNLVVAHGEATVSLGADEMGTGWESVLTEAPSLQLVAPEGRPWSEVWQLQCSAIWPCTATGLPPVTRVSRGVFTPEYRPWPGESLTVALQHPRGIEGQTLTIDSVSLQASPGKRLERVKLLISARSSREQPLVLRLPQEAELQSVTIDNKNRAAQSEAGELRLTIPAGSHRIRLHWQQPHGLGIVYSLPKLGLSTPAVNVTQQLSLPPNRWLLAVRGPAWGPAVLFWPYLVFLLAVAFVLGRLPMSPLSSRQWLLLGLGLSQLPSFGALLVAGFVFALALRGRRPPRGALSFDLLQMVLVAWAVVSLVLLYLAIQQGLLFRPDMQVAGGGSSDTVLRWYADRVSGDLPSAGVVSLPLWCYRVAMLAWSLWLAAGLVRATREGWRAFGSGGFWRGRQKPPASPVTPPPDSPAAADSGSPGVGAE